MRNVFRMMGVLLAAVGVLLSTILFTAPAYAGTRTVCQTVYNPFYNGDAKVCVTITGYAPADGWGYSWDKYRVYSPTPEWLDGIRVGNLVGNKDGSNGPVFFQRLGVDLNKKSDGTIGQVWDPSGRVEMNCCAYTFLSFKVRLNNWPDPDTYYTISFTEGPYAAV